MFADVIVDVANSEVDKVFEYQIPDFLFVKEGDRVSVPFGNRKIQGYILKIKTNASYDVSKIRNIIAKCDEFTPINQEMIELMNCMINKYHLRKIDVLRLFIPSQLRNDRVNIIKENLLKLSDVDIEDIFNGIRKSAKNQIAIIRYLQEKPIEKKKILNAKFGKQSVKKLKEMGYLEEQKNVVLRKPDYNNIEV